MLTFTIQPRSPGPANLGDPAGFARVYDRYHIHVFRFLYGLTSGPQQDVEDLTAETFMRAWKSRHKFSGDDPAALSWLLHIARNLVIDRARYYKVRDSAPDPLSDPAPGPEDIAQAGEDERRLLSMLGSLPNETREMLVLRYMLGWKVTHIAGHLAIPENTVSVTIRRALERLRRDWPQAPEE